MNFEQPTPELLHLNPDKLVFLINALLGESTRLDDNQESPSPGRWDLTVRDAFERLGVVPSSNLWALGPLPDPWFNRALAALNPQPLPPRFTILLSVADVVASRAALLQELNDRLRREQDSNVALSYISEFVDDCGMRHLLLRIPKSWWWLSPPPRPNWSEELTGIDLLVLATRFAQLAKDTFNADVRKGLADASRRLSEAGISQMRQEGQI